MPQDSTPTSVNSLGRGIAAWSINQVNTYIAPRVPAVLPHQVGVIPNRAGSFQARAEAERLRTAVNGGGTAVLSQVLTGLGGVGKTQLAADYAQHAWDTGEVEVLLWVTASSRTAIVTTYAQAGVELCGADPGDSGQAAAGFLAWLRTKRHRWLIVLDDLADIADVRGLWPPDVPHGRTLVTTRRRDAALTAGQRHLLQVGVFTPEQAIAYLTNTLARHHRVEPAKELVFLAAGLGHLPLALSQAAAYLTDQGMSVATYRRLLADRTRTLADAVPEPDALPDDQTLTLAALWSLSVERADQLRPAGLARPMLHLTAMLEPNGIPQTALTSQPALRYLSTWRTETGGSTTSEEAIAALRALHRMSVIDHTPNSNPPMVRIHQLVQRTSRDTLTNGERSRSAKAAADALETVWPAIERDPDLAQVLRANTGTLAAVAGFDLFADGVHKVLLTFGRSLGASGQVHATVAHFWNLVRAANERLGPDHPDTLTARHDLAHWRGEAGERAGAADAFADLLRDRLRILGPDHPDTLSTRNDLAFWRGEAGERAGAADAFATLLSDRLRILGPDNPGTLSTRSNLARLRGEAGDPAGAADAFVELVTAYQRVLGPDHLNTLITRHNLSYFRGEAGDPVGAADGFAEVLTDFLRVLGPDHLHTLGTRSNLAGSCGVAGDPIRAADAFADLLTDYLRVLGPDHASTLATRRALAYWQEQANGAVNRP